MTTKTILIALFIFINSNSFCQPAMIRCSSQNNPDRSVSIYASSESDADYTVKLIFSTLSGYTSRSLISSNSALAIINKGNTEIIKLTPDISLTHALQYKCYSFPGHSFTKMPDTSLQYLIPASAGNQVGVISVSSTVSLLSQKLGTEFRGTGFIYKLNDTICASRAGTVFEVSDTTTVGEKTYEVYKRGRNRIEIEHRDGTIGNYAITAPIHSLVSPGDEVFPGQPLAVFNKESERYMVIFSTRYLNEKSLLAETSPDYNLYYIYMPIYFYASENERSTILERTKKYFAQHPPDIISKEMTKKEKKKFGYQ